jgi:acyl transferase domain-containing protein
VGITDNFFALGGDSIKVIRFRASIHQALGIEHIPNQRYPLSFAQQRFVELLAMNEVAVPMRSLKTSHAFHSPMMQPLLREFRKKSQIIRALTPW